MDQELLMKVSFIQKQMEELEQNLQIIDREIDELQKMDSNLSFLIKSNEKSLISSLGKGIHIKTTLESKELFVEVGAGVVVKKSPEEGKRIIDSQIKRLTEARFHMANKFDLYQRTIEGIVQEADMTHNHS